MAADLYGGFDHDKLAVYVWRSVRAGGDTRPKSRAAPLKAPTKSPERSVSTTPKRPSSG